MKPSQNSAKTPLPTRLSAALAALLLIGGAGLGAEAAAQPAGAPTSFAGLAETRSDAVVNISTRQTVTRSNFDRAPNFPPGSPFEEFFKDFFGDGDRPSMAQSLGSGFVIDSEGFIVTNNHVIEGADEVTVNFPNGDSYEAEIVGRDPKTDIALLKLLDPPAEPLPVAPFGDSDTLRVGDWVMAIGNPFGLGGSVSAGIVSARGRAIDVGPYDDFIQTDAAINRGNSGGPLFNLAGEVIGVNTAIYSPTGGWVGIGFATPSNIAAEVAAQLREHGVTRRGFVGVSTTDLKPEQARERGFARPRGALVLSVVEDAPADAAGLKEGDVIVRFGEREVADSRAFTRMVAGAEIEEPIGLTVHREGEELELEVTVGLLAEEAPEIRRAAAGDSAALGDPESGAESRRTLGMALEPLTEENRRARNLPEDQEGALVIDVASTGPAAQKGVRIGDVVVEVGNEKIFSPEEVAQRVAVLREEGRSSVVLLIRRAGDLRFISLRLNEEPAEALP